MDRLREKVKETYARAIRTSNSCCGSSCCCSSDGKCDPITTDLYSPSELGEMNEDLIVTSFGCGNPTSLIELREGEVVLDLGSGAGLDVLLSAKRVGPTGKAYGLDMTDEMLEAARENQLKHGITNAEFLQGHIEDIPLPAASVDVIISNCVINLSGDKDKVLHEAFRVLKPGGRFAVSDVLVNKPLPEKVKADLVAWSGCVAGALSEQQYTRKLSGAGFKAPEIKVTREYDLNELIDTGLLPTLNAKEVKELRGAILSAFITAEKPLE